ncbi:MAG TPA: cytidine deaminase [Candidatus Galloscillospira excrementipullorum]|nr:cytidine deaminase [Candidatus Galloscillospira excrementipullorum]
MDDMTLLRMAHDAMKNAYVPYSNFPVGAALLCEDGSVYTGCNVEGASYGNAICAERTALCKAVSEGKRRFDTLAVTANTEDFCTPCGICRQMLYEFSPDLRVLCGSRDGSHTVHSLKELLPCAFSAKDL